MSGMVAGLGILISLRSPTVQSAAQTIMILLFMPFLILQAVVFLLPTFLPEDSTRMILDRLDITTILVVILGILAAANVGFSIGSVLRFQRDKMIL